MMKKDYKKYMILITYALVLIGVLINIKSIFGVLSNILEMLAPLWIGIILAFTLNVPMSIIEKKIFGKTNSRIRLVSLVISILMVVILLLFVFVWVIPDFIDSATYLLSQIPNLLNSLNDFLLKIFKNTELTEYLANFTVDNEFTNIISNAFKGIINNFSSILSNLATFVINLVTGIIIAVYFLVEKESILKNCKKLLNKIFNSKIVAKLDKLFALSNKCFHDFITYQCLECLILGVLMFIAFIIFRFPYALTIACLTALTAIVPIFGATIACVIGAILIGTVNINQAIIFLIVFQVVQQIEGNLIYPHVVGKNIGLPPVLTILALIIGGKLGGLFGMIICIPITAIVYSLIWTEIQKDDEIKLLKND